MCKTFLKSMAKTFRFGYNGYRRPTTTTTTTVRGHKTVERGCPLHCRDGSAFYVREVTRWTKQQPNTSSWCVAIQ